MNILPAASDSLMLLILHFLPSLSCSFSFKMFPSCLEKFALTQQWRIEQRARTFAPMKYLNNLFLFESINEMPKAGELCIKCKQKWLDNRQIAFGWGSPNFPMENNYNYELHYYRGDIFGEKKRLRLMNFEIWRIMKQSHATHHHAMNITIYTNQPQPNEKRMTESQRLSHITPKHETFVSVSYYRTAAGSTMCNIHDNTMKALTEIRNAMQTICISI